MTLRRSVGFGLAAVATLAVGLFVVKRLWPRAPVPLGYVVSYQVTDDNSAFLLWSSHKRGWLSRVDANGHTIWYRELPASPSSGNALRVGKQVVAVRYDAADRNGVDGRSMVAFDFDGKRLWDRDLAPNASARLVEGTRKLGDVDGAVVGDYFVEWIDTGKQLVLSAVDQQTSTPASSAVIPDRPAAVLAFTRRAVWFARSNADLLVRPADPTAVSRSELRTADLATGSTAEAAVLGRGCRVADGYLSVVEHESAETLVNFQDGDLARPRVIVDNFDPLGDKRRFAVRACGQYRDKLLFMIEALRGTTPEAQVVLVNQEGAVLRSTPIRFDPIGDGPGGSLLERFTEQAPLSGILPRYVPIAAPLENGASEVVVLDLETLDVVHRYDSPPQTQVAVFRSRERWYVAEKGSLVGLAVSVLDARTGEWTGRATALTARGAFDSQLLPTHLGPESAWIVAYEKSPIDRPSIAILAASSVEPRYASSTIAVRTENVGATPSRR